MANEYIINYSSDVVKSPFVIDPRTVDTQTTSLTLFGKGAASYGEGLQENLVRLLENFCSDSAPAHPTEGQIWYDHASKYVKVYQGSSTGWVAIAGLAVSVDDPLTPADGQLWFNPATGLIYVYSANEWKLVSSRAQSIISQPTNPVSGQLWYDIASFKLNVYSGGEWQGIANSTYMSEDAPIAPKNGDMWYNPTALTLKMWLYSEWVEILSTTTAKYSASSIVPTNPVNGTFWYDTSNKILSMYDGNVWRSVLFNDSVQELYDHTVDTNIHLSTGDRTFFNNLQTALPLDKIAYLSQLTSNIQQQINSIYADYVAKTGGIMSGPLMLSGNPTSSLQAATKAYVDQVVFGAVSNITSNGAAAQQDRFEVTSTVANQTLFPLSGTPVAPVTFVDGVYQSPSSYAIVGSDLTLTAGITAGSEVFVVSTDLGGNGSGNGVSAVHKETFTATAGQTVVTLSNAYVLGTNRLFVYVDGVKQFITDSYTETNTTSITFVNPLEAGQVIDVVNYALMGTATIYRQLFTATASQTIYNLTTAYYHSSNVNDPLNVMPMVFVDGITQGLGEFTETNGASFILAESVPAGTLVEFYVFNIN
jgi:hypothetical protein